MDGTVNILNWFEIYVDDIARATKFYETIFDIKLEQVEMMGMKMAMFPSTQTSGKVSGSLVQHEMRKPSEQGALIYFNGNPDLSVALAKVEAAGGKVTLPKTNIGGDMGFMAFFVDTEGNGLGMHSLK